MTNQRLTADQNAARRADGKFGHTRNATDGDTAADRASALDNDAPVGPAFEPITAEKLIEERRRTPTPVPLAQGAVLTVECNQYELHAQDRYNPRIRPKVKTATICLKLNRPGQRERVSFKDVRGSDTINDELISEWLDEEGAPGLAETDADRDRSLRLGQVMADIDNVDEYEMRGYDVGSLVDARRDDAISQLDEIDSQGPSNDPWGDSVSLKVPSGSEVDFNADTIRHFLGRPLKDPIRKKT